MNIYTTGSKTYISRALAQAFDMPIGDPFGGPAYGKREMPAVAIAAGAFAAAEIATVGLAAMGTFTAIASIGAVAAGVGALVGSEDLMKVGGVMALAGGVGNLGAKAGWWSSDPFSAAGNAAEAASSASKMTQGNTIQDNISKASVGTEAASASPAASGAETLANAATDGANAARTSAADFMTNAGGPVDASTKSMMAGGPDTSSLYTLDKSPSFMDKEIAGFGRSAVDSGATSLAKPGALIDMAKVSDPINKLGELASQGKNLDDIKSGIAGQNKFPNLWSDLKSSLKEDKELWVMGGGVLNGAMDHLFPTDKDKAVTDLYSTRAELERQSAANASAPVSLQNLRATGASPFRASAPAYATPRPASRGLIYGGR